MKNDMEEKDKLMEIVQVVNESAALGLSITVPYFTERRFLNEENISYTAVNGSSKGIAWGQIVKVGKPIEKDPKFFLTALQKLLYSCSAPNSKLLFLIIGGDYQGNGIFIGIDSQTPDALDTLKKFISSSWPGTVLLKKEVKDSVLLNNLSQDLKRENVGIFGAVTGIPSMDSYDSIYPSTIDHLIEGMSNCNKYAYLVVAEPIENQIIDNMIYQCREIQGQAESLKNKQVATNITNTVQNAITKNESIQYKTIQDTKAFEITTELLEETGKEALIKLFPQITKNKELIGNILGGIFSCIPYLGNGIPTKNVGIATTNGSSESVGSTMSKNIVNKHVEAISNHLMKYAERFELGKAIGMWNVKTYLMTSDPKDYRKGEMLLKSILSGQESKYEPIRMVDVSPVIYQLNETKDGQDILNEEDKNKDISIFNFPSIEVKIHKESIEHPFGKLYDYLSSIITTKELTSFVNFPLKSVPGIIVKEQATFGRNIISSTKVKKPIRLGSILHLGECDENNHVELDINALSSHAFIAGTTGSGKSNTIYLMLEQLIKLGINFLVIEPAKGEYKDVFGNDVRVLGGNPEITELLRINPFKFPKKIHVLEHVDALVEIFNTCWPMYAAMPVVLKHSVTEAYKKCGWDLEANENPYGLYPTMKDVLLCLNEMMNESQYSNDTKSDYKGALETRLASMSEGLVGQMLNSANPISDEELFNHNVIVDLSRIKSTETKSLLMGLLVLKLQEWRTVEDREVNQDLQHVTVLEEAHHLLRRTNMSQSQESANLVGKSVEMIVNGIAEMRTYGEGFIIADQSPALLDLAVIRNTNTKIIMALPEAEDRETAGKSIGLKSEQIEEISKQKRGEAIVYQNAWEEAVQCKVDLFMPPKYIKRYQPDKRINECKKNNDDLKNVIEYLYNLTCKTNNKDINEMKEVVKRLPIASSIKCNLLSFCDTNYEMSKRNHVMIMNAVAQCLGNNNMVYQIINSKENVTEINDAVLEIVMDLFPECDRNFYRFCIRCLFRKEAPHSKKTIERYNNWIKQYYK